MTTTFWILLIVSIVMYLEGLVIASFAGAMSQPSKVVWPLLLLFWPIALPVMAYKTYAKYRPLIQQLQENPLLGSLLGISRPPENPLAGLFGPVPTSNQPNPFLTNLFTEAEPMSEDDKAALEEKPAEEPAEGDQS